MIKYEKVCYVKIKPGSAKTIEHLKGILFYEEPKYFPASLTQYSILNPQS